MDAEKELEAQWAEPVSLTFSFCFDPLTNMAATGNSCF
jgi:hypothetical protein